MSKVNLSLWGGVLMACLFVSTCQAKPFDGMTPSAAAKGIQNFGDPNAERFKQRLRSLLRHSAQPQVVTITQFGDSHSAADFFTGELRKRLQARYGDAGIGWIAPMAVPGQYHTAVSWKSSQWQLVSSRTVSDRDFAMGGFIATPESTPNTITVSPQALAGHQQWQVKLRLKPHRQSALTVHDSTGRAINYSLTQPLGRWQTATLRTTLPIEVKGLPDNVELASFWLQKARHSGVILSSIATNGAKLSIWERWSSSWLQELTETQSDLVILAYGTNEAFDASLDANEYQRVVQHNIRLIKQQLPKAAILILAPPDTLVSLAHADKSDERQPPSYALVRRVLLSAARSEHVLFWDWQAKMGGKGIIETWVMMDLARADLVHLTREGYARSAKLLYQDLLNFVSK